MLDNYCAFSENHKYLKWENYELNKHEPKEANSLCHNNRIEIQRLRNHIAVIKEILDENGIDYPEFF